MNTCEIFNAVEKHMISKIEKGTSKLISTSWFEKCLPRQTLNQVVFELVPPVLGCHLDQSLSLSDIQKPKLDETHVMAFEIQPTREQQEKLQEFLKLKLAQQVTDESPFVISLTLELTGAT